MNARGMAGAFLLGLAAGVVIGEVVSRATQAAAEQDACAVPGLGPLAGLAPLGGPVPAELAAYAARCAAYRPPAGAAPYPPLFRPVLLGPLAGPPDSLPVPAGDTGARTPEVQPVNPAVSTPGISAVSAGQSACQSVGQASVSPADTPDPAGRRESRPVRRTWRYRAARVRRMLVDRSARLGRLVGDAAMAAGLALALAWRAAARVAELPAVLRFADSPPGPVATLGRMLPGRTLAIAVRMHPLRGGPVVPTYGRPSLLALPGMVPV